MLNGIFRNIPIINNFIVGKIGFSHKKLNANNVNNNMRVDDMMTWEAQ